MRAEKKKGSVRSMKSSYSVTLKRIISEFQMESVEMPEDPETISVHCAEVNRPGLELNGYYEYYDADRIQIFGRSEMSYLSTFKQEDFDSTIVDFMRTSPVAVVVTRNIEIPEIMRLAAKDNKVPLLRTKESTSSFVSALIAFLNVQLAPRITRHGVLVEVYGEGVLLLGESGVGKSETAIELVKRGHRLIADDAVEIRRVSAKSLVGASPENIRHFIELRGVGIINAKRVFGMGAVKPTVKIDMIINLEQWVSGKVYDRMGLEEETTNILGLDIRSCTIPVKPGRNLAVIIEVAAINNRQKRMGYNAAEELLAKLGMSEGGSTLEKNEDWDMFY